MENNVATQVCSSFKSLSVILFRGQDPIDHGSDQYAIALKAAGVGEVYTIPVLSFEFKNLELLQQQLLDITFDGLILTSPRAVEAVQKSFVDDSQLKNFIDIWKHKHIFCVGPKTAEELNTRLNLQVSLDPESLGDGHKLGAQVVSFLQAKNVKCKLLLPSSAIGKMYSVEQLRAAGHEVVVSFVYDTIPIPDACDRLMNGVEKSKGSMIILVIFSPSNLNAILPQLRSVMKEYDLKMIAIGPTTEKAIVEAGIPIWSTCTSPTPEGLIKALRDKLL